MILYKNFSIDTFGTLYKLLRIILSSSVVLGSKCIHYKLMLNLYLLQQVSILSFICCLFPPSCWILPTCDPILFYGMKDWTYCSSDMAMSHIGCNRTATWRGAFAAVYLQIAERQTKYFYRLTSKFKFILFFLRDRMERFLKSKEVCNSSNSFSLTRCFCAELCWKKIFRSAKWYYLGHTFSRLLLKKFTKNAILSLDLTNLSIDPEEKIIDLNLEVKPIANISFVFSEFVDETAAKAPRQSFGCSL